jgi:WD40 repeat protein
MALFGSEDGTLLMWDLETGEAVRRLTGHSADVRDVIFPQNGQMLLSASDDQSVIMWRFDPLESLLEWTRHNRYVRELNCAERQQYHVASGC